MSNPPDSQIAPDEATYDFVGPPHRVVRGLSWGALVFTPFWLFGNGFWISLLIYAVCAFFLRPVAIAIVVLFFFFGARWSWSKGQRWRSYEEFVDHRYTWEFLSIAVLVSVAVILALEYLLGFVA